MAIASATPTAHSPLLWASISRAFYSRAMFINETVCDLHINLCKKTHTKIHTHTHTNIYVYIDIYFIAMEVQVQEQQSLPPFEQLKFKSSKQFFNVLETGIL